MPTSRSYGDACAIARALDVVEERWALLVVRELLLGPRRFTDLRRALPGSSSNLLSDRLRELEGRDVIRRRKLPPPASSWVYELTEWGRELEPIVLALGMWGIRVPLPPSPATLSATSVLLFCEPPRALIQRLPQPPIASSSMIAYGPSEPRPVRCMSSQANPPTQTPTSAPTREHSTPYSATRPCSTRPYSRAAPMPATCRALRRLLQSATTRTGNAG